MSWGTYRKEFEQLAREEEGDELHQRLCATCDYSGPPAILDEKGMPQQRPPCVIRAPENGLWMLSSSMSAGFLERFRAQAAHAGLALGAQEGTDPEGGWLHRLYSYVRENYSEFLAPKIGERASALRLQDTALNVCEASAIFCSSLERKALGHVEPESSSVQNSDKTAQNPESKPTTAAAPSFTYSVDYRNVTIRGEDFVLTPRQAQTIQILNEARQDGKPDVSIDDILEQLETSNSRWQDTFRSNPEAKEALIKSGVRKGTLRLNL
jgi:hypothetical protein